ncbi:peptidylprolyl isomerase [Candidatus Woesearchaeota archaeon]|nr:peptidylprolyl isomerase [Candidatus Woesearchaeota archaeon]
MRTKESENKNSNIVKKGDKIKVDYEGKLDSGEIFDTSKHGEHSHPLEFEVGSGLVIKGFDESVIGMKVGEEKDITIKPEEAYGFHNESLLRKIPKAQIPLKEEPKIGMMLILGTPDGQKFPVRIAEVTSDEVTLDLNHPLAGKTLHFKIKLLEIN